MNQPSRDVWGSDQMLFPDLVRFRITGILHYSSCGSYFLEKRKSVPTRRPIFFKKKNRKRFEERHSVISPLKKQSWTKSKVFYTKINFFHPIGFEHNKLVHPEKSIKYLSLSNEFLTLKIIVNP